MTNPRLVLRLVIPVVALAFVAYHVFLMIILWLAEAPSLPEYEPVRIVDYDQGWSRDDLEWYNHASQGGAFSLVLDYDWLMALERPDVPFLVYSSAGKLMDPYYMARFGFLIDETTITRRGASIQGAPGSGRYYQGDYPATAAGKEMPVGFTRTNNWRPPLDKVARDVVGFNCAACHTGQVNSDSLGIGVRIQGGAAMVNLTSFEKAVGSGLILTDLIPWRWNRFANEVLGCTDCPTKRDSLREELRGKIKEGTKVVKFTKKHSINALVEGFGRLDALARIGNFVFGEEMDSANYVADDAPVAYPHIWNTPWFDWIQYNAAIKQPIVRNAGEAMGVFSKVQLDPFKDSLFSSTIDVVSLYEMEELVRGHTPKTGLQPPQWPTEVFGEIDDRKAAAGAQLYEELCQDCHLPVDVFEQFDADTSNTYWTEPTVDPSPYPGEPDIFRRYLKLKEISLWKIGTDTKAAANFIQRVVNLGELGMRYERGRLHNPDSLWKADSMFYNISGYTPGGPALQFLVTKAVEQRYRDLGIPESLWPYYDGLRPNEIQAKLIYKARPLHGVWATPPYLHNGSVVNIYELLSPVSERQVAFYLGSKSFNARKLGYDPARKPGLFLMDTRLDGNRNIGHEFRSCNRREEVGQCEGVIGPALTVEERYQIIEFLKTI